MWKRLKPSTQCPAHPTTPCLARAPLPPPNKKHLPPPPPKKQVMETIDKVVAALGAADIDARLEEQLVDGILYAFQEQVGGRVLVVAGLWGVEEGFLLHAPQEQVGGRVLGGIGCGG